MLGIGNHQTNATKLEKLSWLSLIGWVGITAIGWAAHSLLLMILARYALIYLPGDYLGDYRSAFPLLISTGCFSGGVFGSLSGVCQWLILRRQLPKAHLWWVMTGAGWATAGIVYSIMWLNLWYHWEYDTPIKPIGAYWWIPWLSQFPLLITWMISAIGQWWLLRREVSYAGWWIITSAFGWYLSTYIGWNLYEYEFNVTLKAEAQAVSMLIGGVVFGALTALSLKLLLNREYLDMKSVIIDWSLVMLLGWIICLIPASLMAAPLLTLNATAETILPGIHYRLDLIPQFIFFGVWGAVVGGYGALIMGVGQRMIFHRWGGQYDGWQGLTSISLIIGGCLGGGGVVLATRVLGLPAGHLLPWIGSWMVIGAIVGGVIGVCQWLVFRRRLHKTSWWILISSFIWAASMAVFWVSYRIVGGPLNDATPAIDAQLHTKWFVGLLTGGMAGGIFSGVSSGLALQWLLTKIGDESLDHRFVPHYSHPRHRQAE